MTTAERIGVLLGVLGFVLALGHLAWTLGAWWVHNRVTLHAEVSLRVNRRDILLVARLVNGGRKPLVIERVALVAAPAAEGTHGALPSLTLNPVPTGGPIAPGDAREYVLVRHPSLTIHMGDIRKARPDDYWISVRTPEREVLRIRDRHFLSTLKSFNDPADSWHSFPP